VANFLKHPVDAFTDSVFSLHEGGRSIERDVVSVASTCRDCDRGVVAEIGWWQNRLQQSCHQWRST